MFKFILAVVLLTVCAQGVAARDDTLRIRTQVEPEVDTIMDIGNRQFRINRVGRGKLGSQILSGDTLDGDTMLIAQDGEGNFAGNMLIDGKNYRVMPNGELRRAGRVGPGDAMIRREYPDYDRPIAYDNPKNDIVDRWHQPGWQNVLINTRGSKVAMWYTPETDRNITYVDVLAFFDRAIGGNPKLFLDAEIAKANEIFQRSGVYIRLNLVGYEVIDMPVEKASTTLSKMDTATGAFREINTLRRQTGADVVHTFTTEDTRRKMCGVAYLGGYKGRWDYRDNLGVTVCHGGETFVHEVAHNFGSDHDEANAGSGFHFWYSLGFNRKLQTGFDEVSTIMSYGNAEVGVFSNPDIICKGEPCGLEEVSDNARSLNETRKWVAFANGPTDGSSSGTYVPPSTSDKDGDGITDEYDTCPNTPYGVEVDAFGCEIEDDTSTGGTDDNGGSTDNNNTDFDGDGIDDAYDNCPESYNPNQGDNDGDGLGNACDTTPNGDVTTTPPGPTISAKVDVSSHGGICTRSRSTNRDYVVNFRGFQNNSSSGSIWAVCPITRGSGTSMIAAEITILPVTDSAGNYNIRCDLVEVYEGNVEETISLSVNPGNTNTGESTHVFDPVSVTDANSSSFAVECQVPRGYAITNIRQVSGSN